jgi:hypothetical protein
MLPELYPYSGETFSFFALEDAIAAINHRLAMYRAEYLITVDCAAFHRSRSKRRISTIHANAFTIAFMIRI